MSDFFPSNQFDGIAGNDPIKRYLTRLIEKQSIPQSLLFLGPEGIGKSRFAETFAKMIIGTDKQNHPDIHHYQPEGKIGMHSIQSMREFSASVYLAPFQSTKKVFIINQAHRMLPTSANALLKTFEEPALDCVIILVSHARERLLPTVLSRCQTIRFQPISNQSSTTINTQSTLHPARGLLLDRLSSSKFHSYSQIVIFSDVLLL